MMITTMVHGHAQRLRSYDLVADAMGISPRDAVGASDTG
jgi:hypothetical protein